MVNNYLDKNGLTYFWGKVKTNIDKQVQHFIDINTTYDNNYTSGTFIINNPSENYKYFGGGNNSGYDCREIV